MKAANGIGAVLLGAFALCGCASPGKPATVDGPYTPPDESVRNTVQAEALSRQAADLIYSDPAQAEQLLRDALTADLFYGPAHNNLGVLYLERGELYEAANEFEWARKLMPGNPDPRLNLAMTLEQAGQLDEAIETYTAALGVQPEHVPSMQGLARALVQADREDERLPELLHTISMRGQNARWQEWAAWQLIAIRERTNGNRVH